LQLLLLHDPFLLGHSICLVFPVISSATIILQVFNYLTLQLTHRQTFYITISTMSRQPAKRQKTALLSCPNPVCKWKGIYLSKHIAQSIHCSLSLDISLPAAINLADDSDNDSSVSFDFDKHSFHDSTQVSANSADDNSAGSRIDEVPPDGLFSNGYHNDLYIETKLLKLLNDKKVHFSLFKEIVDWGKEASFLNYSFNPQRLHRHSQIRFLEALIGEKAARPKQVTVPLTDDPPRTIAVTSYDFCTQYLSILKSDVFRDINNLDVNPESPFSKFKSSTGRIDCINAGSWYARAYRKRCVTADDLLAPVIFTFDESVLYNQQATVAPLKMTSSLLNQAERNKDSNWRPLCLINDLLIFFFRRN